MAYVLSVLLCESVSASVFVRSVRLRWPPSHTYMHDRSPCKQSHSFPVRFLPVAHNKNKQFNQLGTVYRWCGTRIRIRSSISRHSRTRFYTVHTCMQQVPSLLLHGTHESTIHSAAAVAAIVAALWLLLRYKSLSLHLI